MTRPHGRGNLNFVQINNDFDKQLIFLRDEENRKLKK